MSLPTNVTLGMGASEEERVHEYWATLDDVLADAIKSGFAPMTRPRVSPPPLTNFRAEQLNADTYFDRCACYSAWYAYAASCRAQLECAIEECDNELSQLSAAIKQHIRQTVKPKPAEEAIKDSVKADARYNEVVRKRQMLLEKKRTIEPYEEQYGRELRILSRTVELRRQEIELGEHSGAVNHRSRY